MKYIILIALLLITGCASPDYDWEGTADNWHKKVELSR